MNISFLTTWRIPCGIAHYAERLVNELRVRVNVEVVPIEPRLRSGAEALRHHMGDARYYRNLGEQLNRGDIAHIQHQYVFFGGVAPHRTKFAHVLAAVRVPVVLTVHEVDEGQGRTPLHAWWLRRLNRQSFLRPPVAHLIVHSESLAAALRRIGVSTERVSVLPMPVPSVSCRNELSRYYPKEANPLRARLAWEDRIVLTIFGFVVARKGYDVALQALLQLPGKFVLLIAGGKHFADRTGYLEDLQASIRRFRLEQRVHITGYLAEEKLAQAMAATDIALAPFHEMSASASVAELLGYGKPVVASNLPPMGTLAQELGGVTLFAADNSRDLADKIVQVQMQQAQGTMVPLSKEAAFSFRELAEATAAVYRQVT